MLTFTLTNAGCECVIAELLEVTCLSESVDTEQVDAHTWIVRLPSWGAVGFLEAAQEAGLVIHAGRPNALNSDPTFVMAAQHIAIRERKEAHS